MHNLTIVFLNFKVGLSEIDIIRDIRNCLGLHDAELLYEDVCKTPQ